MNNVTFNKKATTKYLLWAFLIAWVLQIVAAILIWNGQLMIGRLVVGGLMFAPLLGVLLAGQPLSGMGWKPRIRGNVRAFLMAWFLPAVFTVIGAAVYFAVFPGHIDLSGEYIASAAGPEAMAQMEAQGLTYPMYVLISAVSCVTYAPVINMVLAAGEEAGWRGFLYPQLKAKFGKAKGWVIGGVIWGAWHWPVMWLIGYEYGADYAGFPIVGMVLFCLITTMLGILCDWLYEKSGSIWAPSIFHGAFNAAATLPMALCMTNTGSAILLGPAPNGLIAALPFILLAGVLLFKAVKSE